MHDQEKDVERSGQKRSLDNSDNNEENSSAPAFKKIKRYISCWADMYVYSLVAQWSSGRVMDGLEFKTYESQPEEKTGLQGF